MLLARSLRSLRQKVTALARRYTREPAAFHHYPLLQSCAPSADAARQPCRTDRDFEVILVDDCSDEAFDDPTEAWRAKGVNLRLFRNPFRQYTKDTRLNGVEQARGELITFVDADDLLTDDTTLGLHVAMLRETKADLLQFQVESKTEAPMPHLAEWTKPLGAHLTGARIFEHYVRENFRSHLIYGKIATRELWQKCLEPARASSVRRYQEDLLLCSLLFFHARSYVGSPRIGYTRVWRDKTTQKALGRTASIYAMLTEFLPYIASNGASSAIVIEAKGRLQNKLSDYAMITAATVMLDDDGARPAPSDDLLVREIVQHCSLESFVKALLTGFPVLRMQALEMENGDLRQALVARTNSLAA